MNLRLLAGCALFFAPAISAQTTLSLRTYIKASNTGIGDQFGCAMDGSGDVVVVGAYLEDSSATAVNGVQTDDSAPDSGAAYVLRKSGGGPTPTWVQEAYLKPSNTEAGDNFGASVAVSGDFIAVGAPNEAGGSTGQNGNTADNSKPGSGAVYIFRRVGTGAAAYWVQEAYLKAPNTDPGDWFGYSVALAGTVLVVGAPHEDSSASGVGGNMASNGLMASGAAYIFRRTIVNGQPWWGLEAYVKSSNSGESDWFGSAVDTDGSRIIVGASGEDSGPVGINGTPNELAASAGAAYIYSSAGSVPNVNWTSAAFLKASNAGAGDMYGYSVAISGVRVAVGAAGEASGLAGVGSNQGDNSMPGAGAVYLCTLHPGPFVPFWAQDWYVKAGHPQANAEFGNSVALDGTLLLVGSSHEFSSHDGVNPSGFDASLTWAGAAYAYDWTSNVTQRAYIKSPYSCPYYEFGSSVALANGSLLVGSQGEDSMCVGIGGSWTSTLVDSSGAVFSYGYIVDCDANDVDDGEELATRDCDQDGIMDGCEIVAGATDCDGNTVPDSCQPDVNGDGVADACQGGLPFCFGTTCPCGNNGWNQNGCGNSQNSSGASLASNGLPSVSFDTLTLVGNGMTASSNVLYFQGTTQGAGTNFGDGLRCATGSVVRLGTTNNVQGSSTWPSPGAPAIHIGGNVPATGGLRTYQAWYRDPNPTYCSASTFNLTNGVRVQWVP